MGVQHIIEDQGYFQDYEILEEFSEKKRLQDKVLMKVGGIFQMEDEKNKNNRIYPSETWDAVFSNKEFQERLQSRGIFGEVDHPKDGGSLRRISHIITKLERKNVNGKRVIWGEAEILDTPDGRIAETLFKAKARVGTSSRGDGSVERDDKLNADVVKNDYFPEGWDFVTRPSVSQALPDVISEEELAKNEEVVLEALDKLVESTEDKKVLRSAFETLEGFQGERSLQLRESIEDKLTEMELKEDETALIIEIDDERKSEIVTNVIKPDDPQCSEKDKEDEGMKENQIEPEVQKDILQMARDLASEQVNTLEVSHKEDIDKLNAQVTDLSARLERKTKEVEAAEQLIDSLQEKIAGLEENTESFARETALEMKSRLESKHEVTEKRLEAAKQIIDAALKKLKEMAGYQERADAGEKLVQAMLDKQETNKVQKFIDQALSGIKSDERREQVKALVSSCESIEDVKQRLNILENIFKPKEIPAKTDPLPGDKLEENVSNVVDLKPRVVTPQTFMQALKSKTSR